MKSMLCETAWIMASHRKLYLSGWYWKVKQRKGAKRATIALARKILSIIYTMLKTGTPYNEEYFEQRRLRCERKRANRLVNELQKLGYGVSTDYLLGLTAHKNHPNTELDALHLADDAIEILKTGKFNHRLLSELICHKDFQRFMLDSEIYVDRIADMRIKDMNAVLEAVRQMALMKNGGEENDLHLRTLEVAQIREDEYFGSLIADDLRGILRDIRNEHRPDTMTADETYLVATVQEQLQAAMNFEGSSEEKQIRSFLATFGIDYDKLSKEQFVSLIEILKLSKYLKSPINQRGKARPQLSHGKGKRKRK